METIFIHRFSDGTLPLRTIMLVGLCLYFVIRNCHSISCFGTLANVSEVLYFSGVSEVLRSFGGNIWLLSIKRPLAGLNYAPAVSFNTLRIHML